MGMRPHSQDPVVASLARGHRMVPQSHAPCACRCRGRRVQKLRPDSGPGWPLNCDLLPLNIKGATRFLRKCPPVNLDIEPPEALWPETKGQAASLARVRDHSLHGAGGHRANSRVARQSRRARPQTTGARRRSDPLLLPCLLRAIGRYTVGSRRVV
jgi:hypothetical protein